ncbi:MAG: methionyl-tRNA formyltransferase [Deltaproteobacteria bacterium]
MSFKVVFMGTPEFARKALKSLVEDGQKILLSVVQPDKPKGRGLKLVFPPVKEYSLDNGIDVVQPVTLKDQAFVESIKELNPDLIIVVAYGRILPKAILDIPKLGCINVHASLLPQYRGAAPIQWPILNGDKVTGVTTMYMDVGLDTGDMILKAEVPIEADDTLETLHDKLAEAGGKLIVETLRQIKNGTAPRIPQDESNATFTRQIKKEDGLINWKDSAENIRNRIRGLNPWPGAFTYYKDKMLKLWKVEAVPFAQEMQEGIIIEADSKKGLLVSTGNGALKIIEFQPEGSRRMTVEEYLIGHKMTAGDKFLSERVQEI